jgi:hypothetical protein
MSAPRIHRDTGVQLMETIEKREHRTAMAVYRARPAGEPGEGATPGEG